jgi:hypothetical protein
MANLNEVMALVILVDFERGEVVGIMSRPVGKGTEDLYRSNT